MRTEPKNTYDQGESAILEFVDGPKDSRFMMTAKTVARDRTLGRNTTSVTNINIDKVTKFRGREAFEEMVQKFMHLRALDGGEGRSGEMDAQEDAETSYEIEGRGVAENEAAKTSSMGSAIVPDSVKRSRQKVM